MQQFGMEEYKGKSMTIDRVVRDLMKKKFNLVTVGVFICASVLVWALVSGGDFSFVLTYGAFARTFAFGLLVLKMMASASAAGVSLKTLHLYALVFASRLCSIVPYSGYLPYDKSGDWFYHLVEGLSLLLVCMAIFIVMVVYPRSYNPQVDAFGAYLVPTEAGSLAWLGLPCLVVACLFHPTLNNHPFGDITWAFSMYLESVAMLPQLYMFQKQSNQVVEVMIGHWVFGCGLGRVLEMVFWAMSYHELVDHSGSKWVGMFVLGMQSLQMLFMCDFFYLYLKSCKTGLPLQLPRAADGIV